MSVDVTVVYVVCDMYVCMYVVLSLVSFFGVLQHKCVCSRKKEGGVTAGTAVVPRRSWWPKKAAATAVRQSVSSLSKGNMKSISPRA